MEIRYLVVYHEAVVTDDLPKIGTTAKRAIKNAVEKKLMTEPHIYGKPLRRSLQGYRKLRVGDYRIVFALDKQTVRILAIMHRSVVYTRVEKSRL